MTSQPAGQLVDGGLLMANIVTDDQYALGKPPHKINDLAGLAGT
jgi:hypothetical protein